MTGRSAHAEAMGAPDDLGRCPLMPTYGPPSLQLVRGEGSWVWDRDGNEYLDLLSGLAVTSLGHANPAVAEALSEQARTLVHTSNLFGTEHAAPLARALDRLLGTPEWADGWSPPAEGTPRGQVFFCNSGAEANECAIKLARRFGGPGLRGPNGGHGLRGPNGVTGRYVVVSAYGSFHGRTLATLHATGQPTKHEAFQPLPEGFRHVAWQDADALEAALDPSVAAVLLEPVQGEGGVHPASPEYFQAVRRLCDERGILLVVDEVQTGLGRTGRWFGHHHLGVVPDVVTMAKALGNGVPIGACWARAEVASAFEPGDHATTFGGQPLATAAARAVLEVMEAEDVCGRAAKAGERLAEGLNAIDGVEAVRGLGLLLAAQLEEGVDARAVAAAALRRGAIVNAVTPSALRLAPSLLISDEELDAGLRRIGDAMAAVRSGETA